MAQHQGQLSILMCKAKSCRPCKVCVFQACSCLCNPPTPALSMLAMQAFSRRYLRMAEALPDCHFMSMYGDESPSTRVRHCRFCSCSTTLEAHALHFLGLTVELVQKLMMDLEVRVTPTFMLYRGGQRVHSICGINEDNLRGAINDFQ